MYEEFDVLRNHYVNESKKVKSEVEKDSILDIYFEIERTNIKIITGTVIKPDTSSNKNTLINEIDYTKIQIIKGKTHRTKEELTDEFKIEKR